MTQEPESTKRPRIRRESGIDLLRTRERALWKSGIHHIAGVDEAGVGPLAGPVVAAAVILPMSFDPRVVNDSKQLTENARNEAAVIIREQAITFCVAEASVSEIDTLNIYHATMLAMRRALDGLDPQASHTLVDGRTIPKLVIPQTRIVGGDAIEPSIAAASILAKVHRDTIMLQLHTKFPKYGFNIHKGYPTPDHQQALKQWGSCPIHRMSYPAVLEWSGGFGERYEAMKQDLERVKTPQELHTWRKLLRRLGSEISESEKKRLRALAQRKSKSLSTP